MPELPEMENYKSLLNMLVAGKPIVATAVQRERSLNVPPEVWRMAVVGQTVAGVERRAKHLLFHLRSRQILLLHLMLGGTMAFGGAGERPDRTAQVELSFPSGTLYLLGLRLGYIHLLESAGTAVRLARLGPEPLSAEFTPEVLARTIRERQKSALKSLLVDQQAIAGIGNCYADEICFRAGILPFRKAGSLSEADCLRLFRSLRTVLAEAVAAGGYMELPLFRGDKKTGGYIGQLRVYDRGDKPCVRCGRPITRGEIGSRKMFYCPACQT